MFLNNVGVDVDVVKCLLPSEGSQLAISPLGLVDQGVAGHLQLIEVVLNGKLKICIRETTCGS